MWIRLGFQIVVAAALLVVLTSKGSYAAVFAWLGGWTPIGVVNVLAQYLLLLATVQTAAFVLFLAIGFVQLQVTFLLRGPVFRLAHGRRDGARNGRRRDRQFFLSERALDALIGLHAWNENVGERLQAIVLPFGRWLSFTCLGTAALLLAVIHWPAVSQFGVDLVTGAVGTYVGANVELVIAVIAFVLSLAPYVVLAVLLFSPAGRRARLRNNSQLVTDATQHLAQLDLRLYRVIHSAYAVRIHLTDTREMRAMSVIEAATDSRVVWHSGTRPYLRLEPRSGGTDFFTTNHLPVDESLQLEITGAVKAVKRALRDIERLGLSHACAAVTTPIVHRLRSFDISFWPSRKSVDPRERPHPPRGALADFRRTIPKVAITLADELQNSLALDLRISDGRGAIARRAAVAATAAPRRRTIHFDDLSEDDDNDLDLIDLLQHLERHIRSYCESVDRAIIRDGARQESLSKLSEFLNRHVLGGRLDTLAERIV